MLDYASGGGPTADTQVAHQRWGYLARLFFACVNRENGTLQHFPFSGSVMEQPSKTLAVFELMQSVFMERLKAETDRK